jgi:hypothetical protein
MPYDGLLDPLDEKIWWHGPCRDCGVDTEGRANATMIITEDYKPSKPDEFFLCDDCQGEEKYDHLRFDFDVAEEQDKRDWRNFLRRQRYREAKKKLKPKKRARA